VTDKRDLFPWLISGVLVFCVFVILVYVLCYGSKKKEENEVYGYSPMRNRGVEYPTQGFDSSYGTLQLDKSNSRSGYATGAVNSRYAKAGGRYQPQVGYQTSMARPDTPNLSNAASNGATAAIAGTAAIALIAASPDTAQVNNGRKNNQHPASHTGYDLDIDFYYSSDRSRPDPHPDAFKPDPAKYVNDELGVQQGVDSPSGEIITVEGANIDAPPADPPLHADDCDICLCCLDCICESATDGKSGQCACDCDCDN